MSLRSLQHLFEPERVLWVGPLGEPAPWVRIAEANLWAAGFAGQIRAVRTTGEAPAEARVADLRDLVAEPRLAVACLPQADLPGLLGELAGCGCRVVILIGGGAGAAALDGERARAARAAAQAHGLRLIGPDRVGVIVPARRLNTGSAVAVPPAGDLAFVTQSDSIATALLERAAAQRIGFSRIVSLGEFAEVELGDVLDYLALDLATRAVLIHLEGIADARRFMSAARAAARIKPVLVLKAGRQVHPPTERPGGLGLRLHRDLVYDAAFARAGLVRVDSIEELFAAAASLGAGAARRGHGLRRGRLALLTNGHGPAELAADALIAGGGTLVRPSPPIHDAIAAAAGAVASLASSVDLGPDAQGDAYAAALDVLLGTPDIDAVLVIHAPAAAVDAAAVAAAIAVAADRRKPRSAQRPVLAAWLGEVGEEPARATLEAAAVPVFRTPEAAVRAFLHRVQHEQRQFVLRQIPSSRPDRPLDRERATGLIGSALAAGRRALNEPEAMALLDAYAIPSLPTRVVPDLEAAAGAARELGYPVALKIVCPRLPQKSSVGGVALDIVDKASLLRRGRRMLEEVAATAPQARVEGLLVQRMQRSVTPIELYLGVETDPTFGPVLLLGHAALRSTGTAIAYLLPPLDTTLAHAMLDETPIGRYLRQQPEGTALLDGVVAILVCLSDLVVEQPAIRRLAIDPLLVSQGHMVVLDAHVELARADVEAGRRLAVRPYPRELEQSATLRDGREIRLRPIRPEDAPTLQQLFHALTPEDRRKRLFSSMRELPDELAARLTQIDYDREMVLVALDPDNPDLFWGGARIAADADNRRAEYSVTIRSDKQGLGLGRICFERVLDYAKARGIEEVWGTVLAENEGMLGLAERLGFSRRRDPDSPDIFITEKRLA
jgi:acetyltransferase